MTAALTPAHVRAKVREVWERKGKSADVIGLHTTRPWLGPERLEVEGDEVDVAVCRSPLEVRERLAARTEDGGRTLVLLTSLAQEELGEDVLARLARQRLLSIDAWEAVRGLFGAQDVDPRLTAEPWMPDALLELVPPAGSFPPVPGHILDRETAWGTLLERALGLTSARPDAAALLEWTARPDATERYARLPQIVRAALARWIRASAGPVGAAVLAAIEAGHGADALAIGLVCEVVFPPEGAEHAAARAALGPAAGRLERFVGGQPLSADVGRAWARVAREVLPAVETPERERLGRRVDAIRAEVRADEHAHLSSVSPEGFARRLERFGEELARVVGAFGGGEGEAGARRSVPLHPEGLGVLVAAADGPGARRSVPLHPEGLGALGAAADDVRRHGRAAEEHERIERVEMALRLVRWLASQESAAPRPAARGSVLADAAAQYGREGSFVDWARSALKGGDVLAPLSGAYAELLARVAELREAQNLRFAALLAESAASGVPSAGDLVPIEEVLDRIVVPLATHHPVLLVVLDGMSAAVLRELLDDLGARGYAGLSAAPDQLEAAESSSTPRLVLAALPTVTEVSRASLLSGALTSGGSQHERRAFEAHAGLRRVCGRKPPVLFHKADLLEPGRTDLAAALREEIAASDRKVVAVVLNAVDDHLAKSDQVRSPWTLDRVTLLDPLISEAASAGRVVVLTSDHGHVLETATELRAASPGERYRQDDGTVRAGEVLLAGQRVVPDGARVVALATERVRYGLKKNGYHGGATPQEVVVPIAVVVPAGDEDAAPGWTDLGYPDWWYEEGATSGMAAQARARRGAPARPSPAKKPARAAKPAPTLDLFPTADASAPPPAAELPAAPPAALDWIARLLASPVYAEQRRLAGGRTPVPPERLRACLAALDQQGGTMTRTALAFRLNVPLLRLAGLLSSVRGLLNVEGFPVLRFDESDETVRLDRPLLERQFEIGP